MPAPLWPHCLLEPKGTNPWALSYADVPLWRGSAIDVGVLHLPQRYLSTEVGNLTCWESAQEVEGFQM